MPNTHEQRTGRLPAARRKGGIAGAALTPTALRDYHIAPLTPYHYLLGSGVNPLALVMNRKKFDNLPAAAQALIRKYSGESPRNADLLKNARAELTALRVPK